LAINLGGLLSYLLFRSGLFKLYHLKKAGVETVDSDEEVITDDTASELSATF